MTNALSWPTSLSLFCLLSNHRFLYLFPSQNFLSPFSYPSTEDRLSFPSHFRWTKRWLEKSTVFYCSRIFQKITSRRDIFFKNAAWRYGRRVLNCWSGSFWSWTRGTNSFLQFAARRPVRSALHRRCRRAQRYLYHEVVYQGSFSSPSLDMFVKIPLCNCDTVTANLIEMSINRLGFFWTWRHRLRFYRSLRNHAL